MKTVNPNRTRWSRKLYDALLAYQITFKAPIGASSYQLMYGKAGHLSVELEKKALEALKRLNFEWHDASILSMNKVNELDELQNPFL